MIELTLRRLDDLVPVERRIIVTHVDQLTETRAITSKLCGHYIAEPSAKNTANALALVALEVEKLAASQGIENPIILSLHADALIKRLDVFTETISSMIASAQKGNLTLLGITPEYPETGYGYIEKGARLNGLDFTYRVDSFREKPDAALAASYIETERFLWNSGIFAWQVSTIIGELKTYLPSSVQILAQVLGSHRSFTELPFDQFSEAYNSLQSIAIDPAVLERSNLVTVVEADIGWKDVGSWDALSQCFKTDANGNLFYGDVISIDSSGITIDSDAKMVACIGVKDLVVVCSEGAVLVCPRERAQDVKYIVEQLKKRGSLELY
jgi:mannose-1-phosphate guanylyltransferase